VSHIFIGIGMLSWIALAFIYKSKHIDILEDIKLNNNIVVDTKVYRCKEQRNE